MPFEIPDDAWDEDFAVFLEKDEAFAKLFSKEQKQALIAIIDRVIKMINFHAYDDKAPHEDTLSDRINQTDSKLRNHRHDLGKQFTAKPEF
jgi:hypothetical protein